MGERASARPPYVMQGAPWSLAQESRVPGAMRQEVPLRHFYLEQSTSSVASTPSAPQALSVLSRTAGTGSSVHPSCTDIMSL